METVSPTWFGWNDLYTKFVSKIETSNLITFLIYSREYQNIFVWRPRDPQQVNLVNTCVYLCPNQRSIISDMANVRPEIVTRICEHIHRVNIVWETRPLWISSSRGEAKFYPREKSGEIYIHRSDSHNAIAKRWRHSKKLHLAARSRATTRGLAINIRSSRGVPLIPRLAPPAF